MWFKEEVRGHGGSPLMKEMCCPRPGTPPPAKKGTHAHTLGTVLLGFHPFQASCGLIEAVDVAPEGSREPLYERNVLPRSCTPQIGQEGDTHIGQCHGVKGGGQGHSHEPLDESDVLPQAWYTTTSKKGDRNTQRNSGIGVKEEVGATLERKLLGCQPRA